MSYARSEITDQPHPTTARARATGTTALGTTETKEHPQVSAVQYRGLLWDLQRVMWRITQDKTLAGCHRWLAPGATEAALVWQGQGRARWGGLQNSHSVWGSPVAAAGISGRRSDEVNAAVETWGKVEGRGFTLLTLTLRHTADQPLRMVWDAVSACWKAVTGTASWRGSAKTAGDRARYGIEHWFRAVEVTHGVNGWHVHIHVLLFHDRVLGVAAQEEMSDRLFGRWAGKAERLGMHAPSRQRGIDVVHLPAGTDGASAIGAYTCKGMLTGIAAEVTTGQIAKAGKAGNRTPFSVLADIGVAMAAGVDCSRDLAIWYEWERDSKGRRQTAWSMGAKDALGVNVLADEQIEESLEDLEDAETIAGIDREVWRDLASDASIRLRILDAVAPAKDADEARRFARLILSDLGVPHRLLSIPMADRGDDLPSHSEALVRDLHRHVLDGKPV